MATQRAETQAPPQTPVYEDPELSLAGTFRTAVDTLMTMQPLMDRIQAAAGDKASGEFVREWRQAFLSHLQETAQLAMDAFVVDFEHHKSTGEFSFSMTDIQQAAREEIADRAEGQPQRKTV